MHRALYLVPGLLIFLTVPAVAATVELVRGTVLISRGDGFQPVTNGAQQTSGTG